MVQSKSPGEKQVPRPSHRFAWEASATSAGFGAAETAEAGRGWDRAGSAGAATAGLGGKNGGGKLLVRATGGYPQGEW